MARRGFYCGVHIWISDCSWSMQIKGAHARAMASVLKTDGIKAHYVNWCFDERMNENCDIHCWVVVQCYNICLNCCITVISQSASPQRIKFGTVGMKPQRDSLSLLT
jgi:hypothetical protein